MMRYQVCDNCTGQFDGPLVRDGEREFCSEWCKRRYAKRQKDKARIRRKKLAAMTEDGEPIYAAAPDDMCPV